MDKMDFECVKEDCVWAFNETDCSWDCKSNCSCPDNGESVVPPSNSTQECSFSCEEIKDIENRVGIIESYIGGGSVAGGQNNSKLREQIGQINKEIDDIYNMLDDAFLAIEEI